MKNSLALVILITVSLNLFAQNLITVQRNGNPTFYTNLTDAMNGALSGDTIYLPGAIYNAPSTWTINKKLHIYGTGHYPDSTTATGITEYQGAVRFVTGADGSLFTGIKVTGSIYVGTNAVDQIVDGLTISRCNISSSIYLSYNGSSATTGQNFHLEENVLYAVYCGYATNVFIERNIITSYYTRYLSGNGINTVRNNIFLANNYIFDNCSNINVENNVFLCSSYNPVLFLQTSTLNNNLFVYNLTGLGTNTGSNNYINQPQASIFVNQTGYSFNYTHDYHIKDTSPGNNGGIDGTDVGIYGTTTPYKEGAVPAHPHIRLQNISPTTDGAGNVNVNIQVGAQDR